MKIRPLSILIIITTVIIILGLLYFNIPYQNMKIKQNEIQNTLIAIYQIEQKYRSLHGEFTDEHSLIPARFISSNNIIVFLSPNSYMTNSEVSSSFIERLYIGIDCYVSKDTFQIIAVENIDGDTAIDIWSINERKIIEHIQNDRDVGSCNLFSCIPF